MFDPKSTVLFRKGRAEVAPPEGAVELAMHSSKYEFSELDVCKMLERTGVELGAGVIPRYGLMYLSAILTCPECESVHACAGWPRAVISCNPIEARGAQGGRSAVG